MTYGVKAGQEYVVALDYGHGTQVTPMVRIRFYNAAGALIGAAKQFDMPKARGTDPLRYVSPAMAAPSDAVAMRVWVGGDNLDGTSTYVKVKQVVLCKAGEDTSPFDGNSGTDYFWRGAQRESPSVFHPPRTVSLSSARVPLPAGPANGSMYLKGAARTATMTLQQFDKNAQPLLSTSTSGAIVAGWTRVDEGENTNAACAFGVLTLTIDALERGETVLVDAAMVVSGTLAAPPYFDGDTGPSSGTTYQWSGAPHASSSVKTVYTVVPDLPDVNTPAANSLISSDASKNVYKLGMFYTFENEVGESAASQITETRVMRPWSNWLWQKPGATGEPDGGETVTADLCADQLAVTVPEAVYNQALVDGAIKWNLYVMAWSDQEPVPVEAALVKSVDLRGGPLHKDAGWTNITPARSIGINNAPLPTKSNRENYSDPPRSRTGLVAGDRLIVLGDPRDLATIRWTSNRPGEYTNFTSARGGGRKTLTTGNLHIPADVVLWQNPQSVDTLTIL